MREKGKVGERREEERPFPCFLCWDCFVPAGARKRDPWIEASPAHTSSPTAASWRVCELLCCTSAPQPPCFPEEYFKQH